MAPEDGWLVTSHIDRLDQLPIATIAPVLGRCGAFVLKVGDRSSTEGRSW
jgi:hypothetical protein